MNKLIKVYASTAPDEFWMEMRNRGARAWERAGAPAGRRAEFEARLERKMRVRLRRAFGVPPHAADEADELAA